ncbi:MAG: HNH endonuclease [Deltaproteobacteria bacterium]|nr:HNH endonuclease [Deltaproteobacteria bacterium]
MSAFAQHLHVHHIRPWAKGGVTDETNLITLCHTCHAGLSPHCELSLFEMLSESENSFDHESSRRAHIEGVQKYREKSFKIAR